MIKISGKKDKSNTFKGLVVAIFRSLSTEELHQTVNKKRNITTTKFL